MRFEPLQLKEFGDLALVKKSGSRPNKYGAKQQDELPPPPPSPPTFSEEELKAAEREGYKKGFLDGEQQGYGQAQSEQADIEKALNETVEKFILSITPLLEDYRAMQLAWRQSLPKLAFTIAQKAAAEALATSAEPVVTAVAQQCLEIMVQEPKLTVTVHEKLTATLKATLDKSAKHLQAAADIIVLPGEDMSISDCRIEWRNGAVERNSAQLWQQIEKAVDALSLAAERDTNTHMETLQTQFPPTDEPSLPKE